MNFVIYSLAAIGSVVVLILLIHVVYGAYVILGKIARDIKTMDYKTQCNPNFTRIHFYAANGWYVVVEQIKAYWNDQDLRITFRASKS